MTFGIIETSQGYFLEGKRRPKQLTNFIIRPRKEFIERPEDDRSAGRTMYIEADLLQQGKFIATVVLSMEVWISRAALRSAIAGAGNLTYSGNGTSDLQRLKAHVLGDVPLETVLLPDMSKRRRYTSRRSRLYKLDHNYGDPTQPDYAKELARICRKSRSDAYWAEKVGMSVERWRLLAQGQTSPTPKEVKGLLIIRDRFSRSENLNARLEENLDLRIGRRPRTRLYQPDMD